MVHRHLLGLADEAFGAGEVDVGAHMGLAEHDVEPVQQHGDGGREPESISTQLLQLAVMVVRLRP